jgi:hypothetical protein
VPALAQGTASEYAGAAESSRVVVFPFHHHCFMQPYMQIASLVMAALMMINELMRDEAS